MGDGGAVSTRLGPVDQIPLGEGRAFLVGDEPVAVFRPRSGGLHALRAIDPATSASCLPVA